MCRLAVGMEGSLSREVVGLNWHAEQLFKKIKFGNQGTSPAKGYREKDLQSPVSVGTLVSARVYVFAG